MPTTDVKHIEKTEASCVRENLLDVAERLFAQNGIAETSVRTITAEAGVNVASINYYFGSREGLFQEILARRLKPLNDERLRLLDEAIQRAGEQAPAVQDVLHALVAPAIYLCFEHPYFARLASQLRLHTDRSLWRDYRERQTTVRELFQAAFTAALPQLSNSEVETRFHYVVGGMHHIWAHCPFPEEETPERLLNSFLAFYSAGFAASPVPTFTT